MVDLLNITGEKPGIIYKEESYRIIGACFEVHNNLGYGFLEAVYCEALSIEFQSRHIPYERNKELDVQYKGVNLNKKYYADFICYDKIILEIKAIESLAPQHIAQVLNYFKATSVKLGLLINFGEQSLHYERLVL